MPDAELPSAGSKDHHLGYKKFWPKNIFSTPSDYVIRSLIHAPKFLSHPITVCVVKTCQYCLFKIPIFAIIVRALGTCKICCFFKKGKCENGKECGFCHFEHDKLQECCLTLLLLPKFN